MQKAIRLVKPPKPRRRLTPVPNPDIDVTPDYVEQLERKRLARDFIAPRHAIVPVGLGVQRAARTVGGLVHLSITRAARELQVANMLQTIAAQRSALTLDGGKHSLTLTPERRFESIQGVPGESIGTGSANSVYFVDDEADIEVELE